MKQRGAALPTVLALVAAVLVIGLAMGTLSTLSLQFNRRQLDGMRAEMAARSGLAHLIAKLRAEDSSRELDPLDPQPSTIGQGFPPGGLQVQEGDYKVVVHFMTSGEGYSTDNLSGDVPAVGWPDLGDDVPRIPPFGLDVVLNVDGPASHHRYRAVLHRVWPYALYANRGPIVLMGQPTPSDLSAQPTFVKGDIYTSWVGDAANGGTMEVGYGVGDILDPAAVLANLEAKVGCHPYQKPDWPAIIGMEYGRAPELVADHFSPNSSESDHFFYYAKSNHAMQDIPSHASAQSLRAQSVEGMNGGNVLDGDFVYHHDKNIDDLDPVLAVAVPPNQYLGRSMRRRDLAVDPLQNVGRRQFESAGFQPVVLQEATDELFTVGYPNLGLYQDTDQLIPDKKGGLPRLFLKDDLELNAGHFVINGSVSNRQVVYYKGPDVHGEGLYVREKKVGMRLQNSILHVKGDLDLGASSFDSSDPNQRIPISGAGATLIVDGQLILGNATINAQDQGFVIYARDIVLKGGGNFHGLMIAENSISILSQDEQPLQVRGALLCAGLGGIILRGCQLEHDPEYLKSIHGGGDFTVTAWKKLGI